MTPAEGVIRETLEETGVHGQVVGLVGVFDSRPCRTLTLHHLYQFVFLCQTRDHDAGSPSQAQEVLDARWFSEQALPEDIDPGHKTRLPLGFRARHGERRAFFDGAAWGRLE